MSTSFIEVYVCIFQLWDELLKESEEGALKICYIMILLYILVPWKIDYFFPYYFMMNNHLEDQTPEL
jgi:hypothetical protein